ncbi:hypothetical protein FN846DRAFT_885576 [Sphaerosporella brunnea]|uniref:deuterolysin n=1 Tax=Sphaerosporella brunnea TaxID=1250544 RepID=A0A5J5FC34_9PEZI|nr:hypothetical protein FN846DRAFT_885576 [Sphaerosporella brunnea]
MPNKSLLLWTLQVLSASACVVVVPGNATLNLGPVTSIPHSRALASIDRESKGICAQERFGCSHQRLETLQKALEAVIQRAEWAAHRVLDDDDGLFQRIFKTTHPEQKQAVSHRFLKVAALARRGVNTPGHAENPYYFCREGCEREQWQASYCVKRGCPLTRCHQPEGLQLTQLLQCDPWWLQADESSCGKYDKADTLLHELTHLIGCHDHAYGLESLRLNQDQAFNNADSYESLAYLYWKCNGDRAGKECSPANRSAFVPWWCSGGVFVLFGWWSFAWRIIFEIL